jgi:dihydrofolate reductase
MRISAIAAIDRSGVIGLAGRIPWHLPRDLKRFRHFTWGKPIIMGRRTFQSLKAPLAGRHHIVLSRQSGFLPQGCQVVHTIDEALVAARDHLATTGGDEAMIIGGSAVFEETVPLWDRVYLTLVEGRFEGDAFFPLVALVQARWRLVEQECCAPDAKNRDPHRFVLLERQSEDRPADEAFDLSAWLDGPTSLPHCFGPAPRVQ